MDPTHDETATGSTFHIMLEYSDGTFSDGSGIFNYDFTINVQVTNVDSNYRMPGMELHVDSTVQDNSDWVGAGPAIGPDNYRDLHLSLSHLTLSHFNGFEPTIKSITLSGPSGLTLSDGSPARWIAGSNTEGAWNAEFLSMNYLTITGDFYIDPGINLVGQPLTLTVKYTNGKSDTYPHSYPVNGVMETFTGPSTDPSLPVQSAPAVSVTTSGARPSGLAS